MRIPAYVVVQELLFVGVLLNQLPHQDNERSQSSDEGVNESAQTDVVFTVHLDSKIEYLTAGKIVTWLDPNGDIRLRTRGIDASPWFNPDMSPKEILSTLQGIYSDDGFTKKVGSHKNLIGKGLPLGGAFFYRRGGDVFVDGISADFGEMNPAPISFVLGNLGLNFIPGDLLSEKCLFDEVYWRQAQVENSEIG